jgi:hypothetical protein
MSRGGACGRALAGQSDYEPGAQRACGREAVPSEGFGTAGEQLLCTVGGRPLLRAARTAPKPPNKR